MDLKTSTHHRDSEDTKDAQRKHTTRLCGAIASERAAVLSFSAQIARVAQWIRAFASGAKGRRFDPCRGYHLPCLFRTAACLPLHKTKRNSTQFWSLTISMTRDCCCGPGCERKAIV